MLLEALKAYGDAHGELPDFYGRQEVAYRIDLDRSGRVLAFDRVSDPVNPKRGVLLTMPYIKRAAGIVPLPVDRGDYLLGVPASKKTEEEQTKAEARTPKVHAAYVALMTEAVAQVDLPELGAILKFARDVDASSLDLPEGFDASRFVAVYVDGRLVTDAPAFQRWWRERQLQASAGADPLLGVSPAQRAVSCSICGESAEPEKAILVPIRGLAGIGGQAMMSLVSANEEVYERHGLERATSASICKPCGNATHQALNQLLASPVHAKTLGMTKLVWWATEEVEDFVAAVISGDGEVAVAELLESISTGRLQPPMQSARFYAVSLGANSSRVVIRAWLDTALVVTQASIQEWLARVAVVDHDGMRIRRPGIWSMLASLAPPGQGSPLDRVSPMLAPVLLAAALDQRPLPASVLVCCLDRLRAEQGNVTMPRAALLKACLVSVGNPNPEDCMANLDLIADDPAYLCGRLLAVLDDASRQATSARNSLVDRSYSAASTMPAVTFTRLLRLHRAHLDKLRRDRPGVAARIQATVENVMASLADIPRSLGPVEQARFALGLYHQQAATRVAVQEARQRRVAAAGAESEAIHEQEEDE